MVTEAPEGAPSLTLVRQRIQSQLDGRLRAKYTSTTQHVADVQLAKVGQGRYFRARTQHDHDAINQTLDTLEPAATARTRYLPNRELYPWPLALAWLLLMWPDRLHWPRLLRLHPQLQRGDAHD